MWCAVGPSEDWGTMKVRLTRKYAERIDGIDLSEHEVGDVIDLPPDEARLIIAEEWAHADRRARSRFPEADQRDRAADRRRDRTR